MVAFQAWHGKTQTEHEGLRDYWAAQGYRFVSLSIYGSVDAPVFAAVMVQEAEPVAQRDWPVMTEPELSVALVVQAAQGYGPVIVAATGTADDHRFAAVFEPQASMPRTALGLTMGSGPGDTNPATIQGANLAAHADGLILSWAASYGTPDDRRFAGIWQPNPDATLWNCDGVDDPAYYYQARFDAEKAAWIRPGFVAVGPGNTYMSLFVANEMGPQQSRHNMTPEDYQAQFNALTAEGYFPVCVQACGADAASANFAALFLQQLTIVPRKFTPTGPVTDTNIDHVVQTMMQAYPTIRHAALAIVHGTKLVYASGYTLAEPDWPLAQPTTFFRLASVSKVVTALAVFQLIDEGLDPALSVQDILNLKGIGGAPADPGFAKVTIQSLLEHTSGLKQSNVPDVIAAFKNVGFPVPLPVTPEMVDAYVASQPLVSEPGEVQVYSSLGYYLLGRVVQKLRGGTDLREAIEDDLLIPLGATRIRASVDLVADQPADEARYQAADQISLGTVSDLGVYQSLMTPDQPLVADGYGNDGDALVGGGGGLSGAATDLARLVAILLDTNDNPALKRATLEQMLSQGAATFAAQQAKGNPDSRAGFGLDAVQWKSPGVYKGNKGGLDRNAAAVFFFDGAAGNGESGDGRWGFVALIGSSAFRPYGDVYPDWPDVMKIAKQDLANAPDLFPQFGMPSL
jgi:CubicO group peptidase (beta-lactamase class C family)